jgi:hypothetical protein
LKSNNRGSELEIWVQVGSEVGNKIKMAIASSLAAYLMTSFSLFKSAFFRPRLALRSLQTQAQSSLHSHGSINPSEIAHFSRLSSLWWDEQGEFGLLHKMNPIRMQFIREKLLECARDDGEDEAEQRGGLRGKEVLDVGCGGGLLSEVNFFTFQRVFTVLSAFCEEFSTSRSTYPRDRRV